MDINIKSKREEKMKYKFYGDQFHYQYLQGTPMSENTQTEIKANRNST